MDSLSESDKVNKLYSCYELLADSLSKDMSQKEDVYKQILSAVNGIEKEKRLAGQFIPVFFKHFPNLIDLSLEAQFDLCEDQDVAIRRQAIKDLPIFCRDCKDQTKRIAMILSQMLTVKDRSELRIVHCALLSLFQIDARAAIIGLCHEAKIENDNLREHCLRFLSLRMPIIVKEIKKNPEIDELLLSEIKELLEESSLDEIPVILKIASTNRSLTVNGKNEIANLIADQIENENPFDPKDEEMTERIIVFLKHIQLLFAGTKSKCCNRFVLYLGNNVLPQLKFISGFKEGNGYASEFLQLLVEVTNYADEIPYNEETLNNIMDLLMDYFPLPDTLETELTDVKINYSYVECLLYTIHKIAKFNSTIFDNIPEKHKNFKMSLQHFACTVKGYSIKLNDSSDKKLIKAYRERALKRKRLHSGLDVAEQNSAEIESEARSRRIIKMKNLSETVSDTNKEDNEASCSFDPEDISETKKKYLRIVALETCTNILTLMKDLFDTPLRCESTVVPSFKTFDGYDPIEEIEDINSREIIDNSMIEDTTTKLSVNSRQTVVRPKMALYIPPNIKHRTTH